MLALLLGFALATREAASEVRSSCDSVSYHAIGLMANVRAQVHSEHWMYFGVRKEQLDTAAMRPVTDASVCKRALTTIQKYMDPDLRPTGISLIHAGKYFVAEQVETGRGYDRTTQYFLDQSLRVVYPCPDGHSPSMEGACPPRQVKPAE